MPEQQSQKTTRNQARPIIPDETEEPFPLLVSALPPSSFLIANAYHEPDIHRFHLVEEIILQRDFLID